MTTTGPLMWRTSSFSGNNGGNCVEVAPSQGQVLIRHSKRHADGVIGFPMHAWNLFVQEAIGDSANVNGVAEIWRDSTDTVVTDIASGTQLRYDEGEWAAFVKGAAAQEFSFAV